MREKADSRREERGERGSRERERDSLTHRNKREKEKGVAIKLQPSELYVLSKPQTSRQPKCHIFSI